MYFPHLSDLCALYLISYHRARFHYLQARGFIISSYQVSLSPRRRRDEPRAPGTHNSDLIKHELNYQPKTCSDRNLLYTKKIKLKTHNRKPEREPKTERQQRTERIYYNQSGYSIFDCLVFYTFPFTSHQPPPHVTLPHGKIRSAWYLLLLLGRNGFVRRLGHRQALATFALEDLLVLDPGVVDRAKENESDRGRAAATFRKHLVQVSCRARESFGEGVEEKR